MITPSHEQHTQPSSAVQEGFRAGCARPQEKDITDGQSMSGSIAGFSAKLEEVNRVKA